MTGAGEHQICHGWPFVRDILPFNRFDSYESTDFADGIEDAFAHLTSSLLFNLNSVAIRVPDDKSGFVTKLVLLIRNHAGRDKINLSR